MKFFDFKRANHTATPCPVERMRGGKPRNGASKGESQGEQGQTDARHEWDHQSDKDDRCRVQMTNDDETDSQAPTSGDITKHRAFVARISFS